MQKLILTFKMSFGNQIGYFSSEEVGKNIFNYDPIPGKFVGCIPLEEVRSAWAL
ncbi:gluconate 2-dehydrogenase subunit 3 family protein [Maribacter sp.]|nr:gluconate 2-dehydrogenase subunit 3 family protein [Maribacter sp.]